MTPTIPSAPLHAALACAAALAGLGQPAHAATVDATLSATYFQVKAGTGAPDFGGSGTPNVAAGSALGPHGMPVVSSSSPGVSLVDPTTHEIEWWSPALNAAVLPTGTGTIALPYASSMYPPNSTGGNDGAAWETAMFSGNFALGASGVVSFTLGSDDDSFIYVDGLLIGQNPGIHGVTTVEFDSPTLDPGAHTLNVFFADREQVGAYLSLNLLSTDVVITPGVPEPGSWALLLSGLGLVGLSKHRHKRKAGH
jgi:hypothetical protein